MVLSNGEVKFCPDEWIANYKLGNIRDDSLNEIWLGPKAQKFRDVLNKIGLFKMITNETLKSIDKIILEFHENGGQSISDTLERNGFEVKFDSSPTGYLIAKRN